MEQNKIIETMFLPIHRDTEIRFSLLEGNNDGFMNKSRKSSWTFSVWERAYVCVIFIIIIMCWFCSWCCCLPFLIWISYCIDPFFILKSVCDLTLYKGSLMISFKSRTRTKRATSTTVNRNIYKTIEHIKISCRVHCFHRRINKTIIEEIWNRRERENMLKTICRNLLLWTAFIAKWNQRISSLVSFLLIQSTIIFLPHSTHRTFFHLVCTIANWVDLKSMFYWSIC